MELLISLLVLTNEVPIYFDSCMEYARTIDRLYEDPIMALPMNQEAREDIHMQLREFADPKCIPWEI
tara:strand:- start:36 stop:236 length:201 start_codon:yes stop_codon:yes gene_type:complete